MERSAHSERPENAAEDEYRSRKRAEILDACRWKLVGALETLGESRGGFLDDELRAMAWPILLGVSDGSEKPHSEEADDEDASWKSLARHKDEEQVQLDVNRAFIYYPRDQTDAELARRKSELSDLIVSVLRRYPYLCYFQGYHDICQVFLLVLPSAALRSRLVARLSVLRIRDFMLTTLEPTVAQLRLIPDILGAADVSLRRHLSGTEPFYALAGTLTMYAHDVQAYGDIARLFDVLLVREPVFSVYMFAQIVLDRRDELFEQAEEDPSMLHLILSKMPQGMDFEKLIADTTALYRRYPPESLPAWKRISKASCLKTAKSIDVCAAQTMEEGRTYFYKQLAELAAAERRKKLVRALWAHRKAVGGVGVAVMVGVLAVLLRRHTGALSFLPSIWSGWSNTTWTYKF
ncbi:GTPase-activating protein gyp10 [Plectosphaerella plurivora]|uniref:GTPase-activating protein gyp10 n=1 Tax=Plectosphaerella plurivora TaxID=936078 RepID=A0A9P8VDU6_9PEZI|nr:GTPase-activating protein gyp10 [Plectosphaerella plurivora]